MKTEEYDGWTNSKTCICNLYLMQEPIIYKKLVAIVKTRLLTASDIQTVYYNDKHAAIDTWTNGKLNFQEIADFFNDENFDTDSCRRAILVIMENEKYNFNTEINGTKREIEKYYIGNMFNFGIENDLMIKCINIKFIA